MNPINRNILYLYLRYGDDLSYRHVYALSHDPRLQAIL